MSDLYSKAALRIMGNNLDFEFITETTGFRSASIDVFCAYTSEGIGGIQFTPESLSIFTDLDINLELSIIELDEK